MHIHVLISSHIGSFSHGKQYTGREASVNKILNQLLDHISMQEGRHGQQYTCYHSSCTTYMRINRKQNQPTVDHIIELD